MQFRKLLNFAVKDSHFLLDAEYYVQRDGVPMGSPLGPVLADLFMSQLEETALSTYSGVKPLLYYRYVDDTFLSFNNKAEKSNFFNWMNRQHPNIRFTAEEENKGSLPFLDVLFHRNQDESISSTVYITNLRSAACF